MNLNRVIVIVGPTGIGKTRLSIELAKRLDGEIINADSTQIYRGMDIATAKVTKEEKCGIPHHLFDIKNIDETYTVYDYQRDGRKVLDDILIRGKTPILVGGTGLYVKALLYNYEFYDELVSIDYKLKTNEELYDELIKIDPDTKIHPNNRKRVERALNYYYANNKAMSLKEKSNKILYDAIFIGLTCDRDVLYDNINKRVDRMVSIGLIEEAKKIYDTNIKSKAVMTPIGYKELFKYFDGKCTLDDSLELIKKRSRNYAKRQYTWNNHQIPVNWFQVNFSDFNITISEILEFINKY